jgi:CBS domain containing-hemolysin-like protein
VADTLSGLVLSELGRPPALGDEVKIGDTEIRVETMVDLGVSEVSLQTVSADMTRNVGDWEVAEHD